MEHPILFINLLLEKLGIHVPELPHGFFTGSFTDNLLQPHVTYTWVVMVVVVILSALAVRSLKMVPEGGQNFFEMVITGIEDFMIGVTGEEGRFMFPLIASLGFFILCSNYLGVIPGFYSPTANLNTTAACARDCRRDDPRTWSQVPRDQVHKTFYRSRMVAHSAYVPN